MRQPAARAGTARAENNIGTLSFRLAFMLASCRLESGVGTMATPAPTRPPPSDDSALIDEAIAAAGGDARRAILGLIRGQETYQAEIAATVSAGYVRRRPD